jgi:N-acetylneuraminic acid mutarotase
MKHSRQYIDAVTLDDHIYVVGGRKSIQKVRKDGEWYDPTVDTWTPLKSKMSRGRHDCTLEVLGRSLYCVGGYDGSSIHSVLDTVERYDPREGRWFQVTIP